jgi:hypothetical protein
MEGLRFLMEMSRWYPVIFSIILLQNWITSDSRDTPNIILDILGFPPEGTMPDITDPEDDDEDKGFCRDWYSQQMYDMPKDSEQDRVKAIEIIDALIKETETENGMIEDGRMSFSFKGELGFEE